MDHINPKDMLSHEVVSDSIEITLKKIKNRIIQKGNLPDSTVSYRLQLLEEFAQFDFGRFLLQNRGVNGYWTHYMLTHPWFGRKTGKNNRGETFSSLEKFLLDKVPIMLATQQRFQIFLAEIQKKIRPNVQLAAIPCGMMNELLYLNYQDVDNISLIGIDYDVNALKDAALLAKEKNLTKFTRLINKNAWNLDLHEEFDLIASNGLTIYEPDHEKVKELYGRFYQALKAGGKLVTSFLTYPPTLTEQCEWDFTKIDKKDLLLQKIIFVDIVDFKFQCYRSTQQTQAQLESVGFSNIDFIYDEAKIFPTVVAHK